MAKNQNNNVAPATQKTEPGAKKDALATALAQIEKQFGKGAIMKLGDNTAMQVDAISTGSLGLDLALGVGGVPRGRIIEVFGPESSGKTTLALHILAEAQKKGGGYAGSEYKVEFVSPICEYADIPVIQELIRQLRHAGAVAGKNTGIHVHINAAPHDARTLRNITNIMYSKEDLLYKALQVDVEREHRYCQKVEEDFLQELNRKKPKSLEEVSRIWYKGVDGRHRHYHESRYHCLNLHSVFQKGTIEFRLFNSTTHAGKIKAYIQLCLAISAQALNQKCASRIKTASTNEKYTFRTWLLRLGMIGDEFKTARKFLLENLEGGIAWKDPEQAVRQKERLRAMKEKKELETGHAQQADSMEEEVLEDAQGMNMT